jgi:hypothetical protein
MAVAPIAGGQPGKIRDLVEQLITSRQPELAEAIRTGVQTRVDQLKAELAGLRDLFSSRLIGPPSPIVE